MDRLRQFEAMLNEIMTTAAKEKQQMDALKLAGKEKKRDLSKTDGQPFNVHANDRTI
ncbi:hypothetical protein [Enterococcus cecorum]|uniref:hypothetical protein n=1 Tax=Enterococcus cecorum TaxID=44008 RepID=UPI00209C1BC5|nr:hypothetical protein [Enterococcus cecorum]